MYLFYGAKIVIVKVAFIMDVQIVHSNMNQYYQTWLLFCYTVIHYFKQFSTNKYVLLCLCRKVNVIIKSNSQVLPKNSKVILLIVFQTLFFFVNSFYFLHS